MGEDLHLFPKDVGNARTWYLSFCMGLGWEEKVEVKVSRERFLKIQSFPGPGTGKPFERSAFGVTQGWHRISISGGNDAHPREVRWTPVVKDPRLGLRQRDRLEKPAPCWASVAHCEVTGSEYEGPVPVLGLPAADVWPRTVSWPLWSPFLC